MKKYIVTILTAFMMVLMTGGPSYALEDRCLAVFCTARMENFWPSLKPDVLKVATSWDQFDDFLLETKAKAHGRKVVIDLDLHGNKYLYLITEDYRTGKTQVSAAGFGYVVNHILKYLPAEDVILISEACYSGEVINTSLHNNKHGENYEGVPPFPIYGGSYNMMNLNNLVYMQYVTGCHVWFEDIRTYCNKKGQARIDNDRDPVYDKMMKLWELLASLYCPELPSP